MKRIIHQSIAFACACTATTVIWNRLGQNSEAKPREEHQITPKVRPLETVDVDALIRELRESGNNESRLKAALRFNEIPVSQACEALERIPLIEDGKLTFPAKLLLMRWAGGNGEEAANWAWIRFRREGVWNDAFREIIAAWAWKKPGSLVDWTKRMAGDRRPELGDISLAIATKSDHPVLDFEALNRVAWSLVQVSPRHGFEAFKLRGGMSTDDSKFVDSLHSVAAVREALMAFENLEKLQPNHSEGWDQIHAMSLMCRWKELDPEDFLRSPYAHLVPDWSSYKAPPIPEGPKGWQREFEEGDGESRGKTPETSAWPQEKQEAWKDYQTLQSYRRKDRL